MSVLVDTPPTVGDAWGSGRRRASGPGWTSSHACFSGGFRDEGGGPYGPYPSISRSQRVPDQVPRVGALDRSPVAYPVWVLHRYYLPTGVNCLLLCSRVLLLPDPGSSPTTRGVEVGLAPRASSPGHRSLTDSEKDGFLVGRGGRGANHRDRTSGTVWKRPGFGSGRRGVPLEGGPRVT